MVKTEEEELDTFRRMYQKGENVTSRASYPIYLIALSVEIVKLGLSFPRSVPPWPSTFVSASYSSSVVVVFSRLG